MESVKIAIVGSRTFNDYNLLKSFIDSKLVSMELSPLCIISGGAKGADSLGERYAEEYHIEKTIFIAEWDKYGKSAGFRRNVDIIKACDVCFAFWDGQSKGTKHDIELCEQMDKLCIVCRYKEEYSDHADDDKN